MTLTLEELKDKIKALDEVTILEILDIDAEALVEMFDYRIAARYETLVEEYAEESEDE